MTDTADMVEKVEQAIYSQLGGGTGGYTDAAQAVIRTLAPMVDLAVAALTEAREALHFHYVEWDGEPEDAVSLQLARAKCDQAISVLKEQFNAR